MEISGTGTYTLIGVDGKPYSGEVKGTLGGWRRGKIYGRLNCRSALAHIARGHYVKAWAPAIERVKFANHSLS